MATGCGLDIFTGTLAPAIASARHEILFVTCFLANLSPSLAALSDALRALAAVRAGSSSATKRPLRIRIGFSSRSLWQRLFHTFSRDGHVYSPDSWVSVLGLPDPEAMRAGGIDLEAKSLFFNPLGILHPKFVIIDRTTAWLPSCNTSWECWFEGCVQVRGHVVEKQLLGFWSDVWGRGNGWLLAEHNWGGDDASSDHDEQPPETDQRGQPPNGKISVHTVRLDRSLTSIPTVLLPSSWHVNPRFQPLPFFPAISPPMTPLNTALLTLLAGARSSIYLISPNVTCPAVLDALLAAVARGVDVHILTSRKMMVLEQLVTAGTTTERCLARLRDRYTRLKAHGPHVVPWWRRLICWKQQDRDRTAADMEADQAAAPLTGTLTIQHYKPDPNRDDQSDEPVLLHFKLTLVDDEYLVLGSGNMDRASWYTSQELGIMFYSPTGFAEWAQAWAVPLSTRTAS